jgi:hypothetical protein
LIVESVFFVERARSSSPFLLRDRMLLSAIHYYSLFIAAALCNELSTSRASQAFIFRML